MASGQRQFWYPWPYTEGLTIEEATNDLAFMVTGAYDKPVAKQHGAPLRIALPWKYGFKSIKSIVRISLVAEMPPTTWNMLQPSEYGFYANVNPAVDHPRWSQASERRVGSGLVGVGFVRRGGLTGAPRRRGARWCRRSRSCRARRAGGRRPRGSTGWPPGG